jgi:site-specific DNA recombinase
VERFTSIAAVIRDADAADKAEIYRGINLILTYQPQTQIVRAQAHLRRGFPWGYGWCPRGDLNPHALLGH